MSEEQEPSRTPRAIAARKMAEWKAQEPDAEQIKNFCPHGCLLTIETCEEGCNTRATT